jgi:hypothetical protein
MPKYNFIDAHEKRTDFPAPIFTERVSTRQH